MFNLEFYINCLLAIATWNIAIGAIIGIVKLGQVIYKKNKEKKYGNNL